MLGRTWELRLRAVSGAPAPNHMFAPEQLSYSPATERKARRKPLVMVTFALWIGKRPPSPKLRRAGERLPTIADFCPPTSDLRRP